MDLETGGGTSATPSRFTFLNVNNSGRRLLAKRVTAGSGGFCPATAGKECDRLAVVGRAWRSLPGNWLSMNCLSKHCILIGHSYRSRRLKTVLGSMVGGLALLAISA